jgi:hypothetical protein
MPRKIRSKSVVGGRKHSRGEIALYVITAIVALSMALGTIAAALR